MKDLKVLNEIIDGWKNLIWENPEIETLAKTRIALCFDCVHLNEITKTCNVCGCFMPAGVRAKDKKCPKGKW